MKQMARAEGYTVKQGKFQCEDCIYSSITYAGMIRHRTKHNNSEKQSKLGQE